jgi:hypothetical protein
MTEDGLASTKGIKFMLLGVELTIISVFVFPLFGLPALIFLPFIGFVLTIGGFAID